MRHLNACLARDAAREYVTLARSPSGCTPRTTRRPLTPKLLQVVCGGKGYACSPQRIVVG